MLHAEKRTEKKRKARKRRIIAICISLFLAILVGTLLGQVIGSKIAQGSKVRPIAEDVPLVNVAMQEIGNEGGEKFWSWYDFDERVDWCAIFASWCEDQVGYLDEKKAPSFALVSDGADWFLNQNQWIDAGGTPEAGDLIFFDWEGDGGRDHVGIVTSVIGNKVFTVEGNSSDRCRVKRYTIGDPVIYGYGHIDA